MRVHPRRCLRLGADRRCRRAATAPRRPPRRRCAPPARSAAAFSSGSRREMTAPRPRPTLLDVLRVDDVARDVSALGGELEVAAALARVSRAGRAVALALLENAAVVHLPRVAVSATRALCEFVSTQTRVSHLRGLHLPSSPTGRYYSRALALVLCPPRSLRELSVHCDVETLGAVVGAIAANESSLSSVALFNGTFVVEDGILGGMPDGAVEACLASALSSLARCPRLASLRVDGRLLPALRTLDSRAVGRLLGPAPFALLRAFDVTCVPDRNYAAVSAVLAATATAPGPGLASFSLRINGGSWADGAPIALALTAACARPAMRSLRLEWCGPWHPPPMPGLKTLVYGDWDEAAPGVLAAIIAAAPNVTRLDVKTSPMDADVALLAALTRPAGGSLIEELSLPAWGRENVLKLTKALHLGARLTRLELDSQRWINPHADDGTHNRGVSPSSYIEVLDGLPRSVEELHLTYDAVPDEPYFIGAALTVTYTGVTRLRVAGTPARRAAHHVDGDVDVLTRQLAVLEGVARVKRRVAVRFDPPGPGLTALLETYAASGSGPPGLAALALPWGGPRAATQCGGRVHAERVWA